MASTLGVYAQSLAAHAQNGALHVRAGTFSFIKGPALARLKDGRSVRFDFDLIIRAQPDAYVIAQARESFVLSYDLWEERFAVTHVARASRSASHLTTRDAEAWCLDRVTVPLASLGGLGRDKPLYIRLEYRVPGDNPARRDSGGFSLGGLIDRLSRRAGGDGIEAGPLMLMY
jgi:hypothetical protein